MNVPLAWVLWHARRSDVDPVEYATRLADFYASIESVAPHGYLGRRTLRYDSLPWLASDAEAYEEWHFVRGSDVLDPLDHSVFHPDVQESHVALARLAGKAAAGLYRLRFGDPLRVLDARVRWFDKPHDESYASFVARMEAAHPRGCALLSRHMVLGPTPEFALFLGGDTC